VRGIEAHLGACTVRPAQDSDGWEIMDSDGKHKGKATLANAFISGMDAMLPLQVETSGNSQMFMSPCIWRTMNGSSMILDSGRKAI
jgi:hypothetical protein